ncbi:AsmA family protein [Ectothiorhodospiraceae bacterium 2226]|nr:AsmA family protein [Ectothiorhodospiraceae bacterium 2226]
MKGIGWALLVLVLMLAVALWWLDWNHLRGPLAEFASRELERTVSIDGDLDVELGWTPRVHVHGLRIADAPWAGREHMAEVERLSASIPLGSVLRGDPEFRDVVVERPRVHLERNPQGAANWDFLEDDPDEDPPRITALSVHEGHFVYTDAPLQTRIEGQLYTEDGRTHLQADGTYREAPLKVVGQAGELPALVDGAEPFPLELEIWYAAQYLSAQGAFDDPQEPLERFTFTLAAEGDDLGTLLQALDVPAPDMDAFELSGEVSRQGEQWRVRDIQGRLKETRLERGELHADTAAEPPRVEGELHLARLDVQNLFEFFGLDAPPEEERERLLPDDPIPVDWLSAFEVHVTLSTADAALWVIEGHDMMLDVQLQEGTLRIDPFRMSVAEGEIAGAFQLSSRDGVPGFVTDIGLRSASLEHMLENTEAAQFIRGRLSGRIELEGRGASVAEALGEAEGQVGLALTRGALDRLVAEGIALNIIELLFGDGEPDQRVRCGVAAFDVGGGEMVSELLLIDTDERVITGDGNVDLREERFAFELEAHAKEAGGLSLQTPVNIEGSWMDPDFGIEAGEAIARGAAAALLGAVAAPLAAVLPFIEPDAAEDHDCQALFQELGETFEEE